jgi:hypothetical protein
MLKKLFKRRKGNMTDSKEKTKEVTEEKEELTEEQQQALRWMSYVRNEVNTLLNIFLPISKSGTVGVKYSNPVVAVYESGPEYDSSVAEGVEIRLVFDFEQKVKVPKESKNE